MRIMIGIERVCFEQVLCRRAAATYAAKQSAVSNQRRPYFVDQCDFSVFADHEPWWDVCFEACVVRACVLRCRADT